MTGSGASASEAGTPGWGIPQPVPPHPLGSAGMVAERCPGNAAGARSHVCSVFVSATGGCDGGVGDGRGVGGVKLSQGGPAANGEGAGKLPVRCFSAAIMSKMGVKSKESTSACNDLPKRGWKEGRDGGGGTVQGRRGTGIARSITALSGSNRGNTRGAYTMAC